MYVHIIRTTHSKLQRFLTSLSKTPLCTKSLDRMLRTVVLYIQEYVIKTQRGPLPERSWRVSRRYNDFVQLNAALSISGFDLPLPPKRIIGNMEPDFIAQRQIALQVQPNMRCSLLRTTFVPHDK